MRANLYFSGASGAVPTDTLGAAALGRLGIQSYSFLPATAAVRVGSTVTWTNDDPLAHTVTGTDKGFDSGRMGPGSTFSVTFSEPGTFEYLCTLHQNMKARLIVE